jgi:hypothetical protein
MSKHEKTKSGVSDKENAALNRREFFKQGAAAGVGLAGLGAVTAVSAHESDGSEHWDYEADIIVIGSGGTGLPAAVRARDLGASVLVLEQNYDVGGKFVHSGGWVSLGGGDHIQERDRLGLDPDNLGLTQPVLAPKRLPTILIPCSAT